jgi:hypothetical protein
LTNSRSLRAWGSLGGLAFVVLFVLGNVLIFDGPNGDEAPSKYTSFYGDNGNRDKISIGWILAGLGLFAFIWFVATLRDTVRTSDANAGRDGVLGFVVTVGGAAYAATAMGAVGLAVGSRTMSDDTYQHRVYSEVIHGFNDATYMMHVTGTAALSAMILAFSIAVLASRVLPRWLGWFGIVAAIAALASVIFVTMAVWLLWIAATSVALFMQARSAGRPLEAATRA